MEVPNAIIQPTFRVSGYVWLNVPIKLVRECQITPGVRVFAYVRDGKVVIEQEKIKEIKDV